MLSLGLSPAEVMLGFLAKEGEPLSGARQFPGHGADPARRVYNLSNVVGTSIPQAVGAALACKMRGEDTVVISYFGDGASSQGDCHEAMNFAAVHKLPVIFFCENNKYAISVPLDKQMAVDSVASRASGYGMPESRWTAATRTPCSRRPHRRLEGPALAWGRRSSRRTSSATCRTPATMTTRATGNPPR